MSKIIRIVITIEILAVLESSMTLTGFCASETRGMKINDKFQPMVTYESEEDIQEEIYFDSLELLAICVEAEAGNQDLYGKRLVVDVILNRVDSDRFPDDIESVISQKYHFSTYWNGEMDKIQEPSEETYEAVKMELEERVDDKILFFSAGGYSKYCTPAYKYGVHYFGY